jgi:nucleoside-diphosphate-sugar epimerase
MKILITGGAGFLGQRLARKLLERGTLALDGGKPEAITRIDLLDVVLAPGPDDPRIHAQVGDIADPAVLRQAIDADTRAIFHLAALLETCRALGHKPRVIFTSSVAVYGGALPDTVRDDTALNPQSSYGTQKAIAELLLADYTRRGYVDGRVLRLPTISVRPGRPNAAASSFASGIIREPLNGVEAACPVSADTRLWLLSPRGAIQALIAGCELEAAAVADRAPINLPGVSVTAAEMVQALREVAGDEVAGRVGWQPDERVERIVGSWPGRWDTARAERLGLRGDADFADIVRAYMADDLPR